MVRVLPDEVVLAYYETGLIPVRRVWATDDGRGASAIDVMAYCHGIDTAVFREHLDEGYEEGFILAWDADDPTSEKIVAMIKDEDDLLVKRGFCDGFLCRIAVEKAFSSSAITSVSN